MEKFHELMVLCFEINPERPLDKLVDQVADAIKEGRLGATRRGWTVTPETIVEANEVRNKCVKEAGKFLANGMFPIKNYDANTDDNGMRLDGN